MKEKSENKIEKLKDQQELLRRRSFFMLLEIAFVFAVPAAIAFVLGRKLDGIFNTGNTIILSLLAVAFISSWLIVIFRFKKLQKEFEEIADQIKMETGKTAEDTGGNKSTPNKK